MTTQLRDRVLLLRSVENFEGLDDEGLTLLAEHARTRAYRAHDVLAEAGEVPRVITVVIEGKVTVNRVGMSDYIVERGQSFGTLAVMADTTTERAVANADTVALEIPVAAFRVALEENFSLLRNSLRMMGRVLSKMRGRLPADPKRPPNVEVGVYYEHERTLVEQLIELRKGPFVHMNIDALVDLARRMTECRVPAGHVFWRAGESCTYALHVEYGRVRCTTPDGTHVDVGQDFTLGVMDLWGGQLRSYEARAETDIIAYRIEYEDFLVISEMHISVALDMLRGLARQYLASDQDEIVLG